MRRIGRVFECGSYLDPLGVGAFDMLGRDEHYCISDCGDHYSLGAGILKKGLCIEEPVKGHTAFMEKERSMPLLCLKEKSLKSRLTETI